MYQIAIRTPPPDNCCNKQETTLKGASRARENEETLIHSSLLTKIEITKSSCDRKESIDFSDWVCLETSQK